MGSYQHCATIMFMAETTKMVHVRVPEHMHDRLADYARRHRRSMNSAAIVLLEQALEADDDRVVQALVGRAGP